MKAFAAGRLTETDKTKGIRARVPSSLCRLLDLDLLSRFVLTQAFEGCLANHAVAGPAGELDLRDELRKRPIDVDLLARRADPYKRRLCRRDRLQARQELADLRLTISSTDPADIDEMVSAIDANKKRPKTAIGRGPAANDHLVPRTAFGLGPGPGAAGPIRCIESLRDDAFERQFAGRTQDRVPVRLEMLDEAEDRLIATALKHFLKTVLPLGERLLSQIVSAIEQEIEGEEDQVFGPTFGESRLERDEIGRAMAIERDDLAIDDRIRQVCCRLGDGAELRRPVQALAGFRVTSPPAIRSWTR